MATRTRLLQLVIHSKFLANGWSDKWYLDYDSFADASLIARRLTAYRGRALAPGGTVTWARMSFVDTPRNTVACLNNPIGPLAYSGEQATVPQDPHTALHFRYETADGQWANRLVRGIGDDVVKNFDLFPSPSTTASWVHTLNEGALPDLNNPGLPAVDLLVGYLKYAMQHTVHAKPIAGEEPSWEVTPWAKVLFRKVGNRDTGKAFGVSRGRARKRVAAVMPDPE